MRTVSRKIRSGEKARGLCDRCGSLWDRRKLWRDAEGLLNCPQEGPGRDAITLTRANVASAKAYARGHDRPQKYPGRYKKDTCEPISSETGNLLAEDRTPLTTEDGVYLLLES